MSENNDTSNESNSLSSDCIVHTSKLSGGSSNSTLRTGVLRPSVLGSSALTAIVNSIPSDIHAETKDSPKGTGSNTALRTGVLRPSAFGLSASSSEPHSTTPDTSEETEDTSTKIDSNNPFMKDDDENKNVEDDSVNSEENKEKPSASESKSKSNEDEEEEHDQRPDPLTLLKRNGLERANIFAAAKSSIPRVEKSGFVFGQNVHERVVGDNISNESASKLETPDSASTSSELLFSSVINNAKIPTECDSSTNKETDVKSLTDVAREYEESRAQKRKFEHVETFTGEENELNIVDINCKLFTFVNSNWEERGRGSLRLNDSNNEEECSRVVFRTSGNLRLLVNTKIWGGMIAERPSPKTLRLTAMDSSGKIKILLVMARPIDINNIHSALRDRINRRKQTHPEECIDEVEENTGDKLTQQSPSASSEKKHLNLLYKNYLEIDEPICKKLPN